MELDGYSRGLAVGAGCGIHTSRCFLLGWYEKSKRKFGKTCSASS